MIIDTPFSESSSLLDFLSSLELAAYSISGLGIGTGSLRSPKDSNVK
ncbi:unnamed protein product [Rhodiola kirilowii]